MAELLICAKDSNGSGPGQYKKGDIVNIYPNGHAFGPKMGLPKFFVLKLPDITMDKVVAYTAPEHILHDPTLGFVKRRIWGFQLDNVPAGVRSTILSQGWYTTIVAAIKPYVRQKNTDAEADFNG